MTEAPASAAAIDSRAISSGVIGRYGVMVGVCTEPVTAQVMMTFRPVLAAAWACCCDMELLRCYCWSPAGRGGQPRDARSALGH